MLDWDSYAMETSRMTSGVAFPVLYGLGVQGGKGWVVKVIWGAAVSRSQCLIPLLMADVRAKLLFVFARYLSSVDCLLAGVGGTSNADGGLTSPRSIHCCKGHII